MKKIAGGYSIVEGPARDEATASNRRAGMITEEVETI